MKSWFSKKMNKIVKPSVRKGKKTQTGKIRNEYENIIDYQA